MQRGMGGPHRAAGVAALFVWYTPCRAREDPRDLGSMPRSCCAFVCATPTGRRKRHCVVHRWVLSGLFPALRNDAPGIQRHGPAPIHLRVTGCQ
jgi:hypothetical protein